MYITKNPSQNSYEQQLQYFLSFGNQNAVNYTNYPNPTPTLSRSAGLQQPVYTPIEQNLSEEESLVKTPQSEEEVNSRPSDLMEEEQIVNSPAYSSHHSYSKALMPNPAAEFYSSAQLYVSPTSAALLPTSQNSAHLRPIYLHPTHSQQGTAYSSSRADPVNDRRQFSLHTTMPTGNQAQQSIRSSSSSRSSENKVLKNKSK